MNAAQERESGYAASLENPCLICRSEAQTLGTPMCGACVGATSFPYVAEPAVAKSAVPVLLFAARMRKARAA